MNFVKYRTILGIATGAALLLAPATAPANTYTVSSCGMAADQSIEGWKKRTTAGMTADLACPWQGDRTRGIAVRNRINTDLRVDQGRSARAVFSAPPGTSLERMTFVWDGYRRADDWTLGLISGNELRAGCRAFNGKACELRTPPGGTTVALGNSPSVRLEARCESAFGCKTGPSGDPAQSDQRVRLSLIGSTIEIRDVQEPGVNQIRGGLWSEGWLRGTQSASFDATDNTGVRATRFHVDGDVRQEKGRACRYSRPIPCENVTDEPYELDTTGLPDGDHELAIEAIDAAGNAGQATRTVRVDNNAPTGAFDPPRDQPVISMTVGDSASGVARAQIQLRRSGASDWRDLDSSLDGSRATARVSSQSLDPGEYELRAVLTDAAGNSSIVERRSNGDAARITIPRGSSMTATLGTGKQAATSRRLGRSSRATARGRLFSAGGSPLPSEAVSIAIRPLMAGAEWRPVGQVSSDSDGRFSYSVPGGPSREIRFEYTGSERFGPSAARVRVRVPAQSSIRASRSRVPNGSTVRFSGELRGGLVPRAGKLVDLQAFYRGRWRTFALPRTDGSGRWAHRYEFGATSGLVNYRFRARLPREDGYPFEPGRSRELDVMVVGR